MPFPPLTTILLAPPAAVVAIFLTPESRKTLVRLWAALGTGVTLVLSAYLLFAYDRQAGGFQFVHRLPWVPALGINYFVGVDGISVSLVLLTAIVIFAGVFVSWTIEERVKEHYVALLALVTGVFGVFTSLNLFFFYFFYELAVIPMFLLIGIWGSGNKEYATMKLTLYLTFGAVIAVVALLALYFLAADQLGEASFDLDRLQEVTFPASFQMWAFPVLLVGFGFLVPMWPFHTWSPIGHAAAPTAASMLHAGVLMKLGSYAILRIAMTLLPLGAQRWLPWVAVLCVANIIYGGFVAMAQKDMKYIIGYSSSSHMGYVLLGIASLSYVGVNGAVFLMFAHGVMTALAFATIGYFYDQTHTRDLPDLGGLTKQIPFIGTCFTVAALASSGLPGFANFVSELMIFLGTFPRYPVQAVLAVFGIVITATYLLRAVRRAFFGGRNPRWDGIHDAVLPHHRLPYVLLIGVLLLFGFYPSLLVNVINVGVVPLVDRVTGVAGSPIGEGVSPRGGGGSP